MKRSEIYFSALLIPIDFLALLGAFVAAYYIRAAFPEILPDALNVLAPVNIQDGVLQPLAHYLHYIWYIIPAMLLIFAFTGLYSMRSATPWPQRIVHILTGVSVGEFFILLLFLLKKDFFLPRSTILYSWILCTLFVTCARYLVRLIQKLLYRYDIGAIRVAIIGKSDSAKQIMRNFSSRPNSTYRLAKRFDTVDVQQIIPQIIKDHFDELVVVSDTYKNEDLIILRNHCLEHHIAFSFVPPLFAALQGSYEVRSEVGIPVIEVLPTPLEGWGRVLKRIFDLVTTLLLIIISSPLLLFIAAWLKISSPGPLIYKHRRIGKDRKPIYVWKFRSMDIRYCTGMGYDGDAAFAELLAKHPKLAKEWEEKHKLKDDPRVSAPGHFLRATSLDELPQFFNVLTGQLSLVGPRPIVEDEVGKYGETARILFTVKPGITGLWQVSGRSDLSYQERTALDASYIENWNLGQDLVILVKTAWVLFNKRRSGAY